MELPWSGQLHKGVPWPDTAVQCGSTEINEAKRGIVRRKGFVE